VRELNAAVLPVILRIHALISMWAHLHGTQQNRRASIGATIERMVQETSQANIVFGLLNMWANVSLTCILLVSFKKSEMSSINSF